MEITWYGHSCFRITERGLGSVVCDPYDYQKIGYDPLKLKADIVTVSNAAPGHSFTDGVKGDYFLIDTPGEYEVNDIFINAYSSNAKGQPRNNITVMEFNGLFVAHMGNMNRLPTQSEVERIGTTHILLVPVGGGAALNASMAVELISIIHPNVVIPMHYSVPRTIPSLDPLSRFLKEMGITETEEVYPSYKISNVSQLPEETKVIILNHPLGNEMPAIDDAEEQSSEEPVANE